MRKDYLNHLFQFRETPHSGYHWDGSSQRFFEGWYFRITLPQVEENFAFMYSIDDPAGNQYHSGGAVQIIGVDEEYLYRTFPNINKFWSAGNRLALTHWGKTSLLEKAKILPSEDFEQHISEGYQATTTLNQGCIHNPHNHQYCRWQYQTQPIYTWGDYNQLPKATAGWLSFFPLFEPGWQVLIAHGLATGYIDWNGKIYQFENVPAYSEKNWGRSFPTRWFWINCNSFSDESDLTVTAVGGQREVLWWSEDVSLIGIHYQGKFYEFASTNSQINAEVNAWGRWKMEASNNLFQVTLVGETDNQGTYVRVPTEKGLIFACRDTLKGQLSLQLKYKNGNTIVQASSNLCGLEVGSTEFAHQGNQAF